VPSSGKNMAQASKEQVLCSHDARYLLGVKEYVPMRLVYGLATPILGSEVDTPERATTKVYVTTKIYYEAGENHM
jgi:hypothetical protein